MKKGLFVAVALTLAALALFATGCDITSPPAPSSSAGFYSQSTGIWVTGEGKATAVPDIATLTLGVQTQ